MIRKIEIERFSLTTPKQFDEVIAGVNAAIGHPDMAEFGRSTHQARSFAELKSAVEKGLSQVGLMLFMQLDHGAVVRKETGRETPKMIRFVIGNPLIMMEMAKHVPDAGSYAPVTVLVDERADGVHLSYDRMASLLAPFALKNIQETQHHFQLPSRPEHAFAFGVDFHQRTPESCRTENQTATSDRITVDTAFLE